MTSYVHCLYTSYKFPIAQLLVLISRSHCVYVHIIHIVNFHPATISLLSGQISIIQRIQCRLHNKYYITLYLTVFIL